MLTRSASYFLELESEAAPVSQSNVHFLSRFLVQKGNSALVRSCLTFGICDSSTNRLFFWISKTKDVRFGLFGDGIWISNPWVPNTSTTWTSMTGPMIVSPGIAAYALDCGLARGSAY